MPFVNVIERLVTRITLMWKNVDRNWNYLLQINGSNVADIKNVSSDVVSHSVTSLKSGTMYKFSVITVFYELHSTAYEDFIVTGICRPTSLIFFSMNDTVLFNVYTYKHLRVLILEETRWYVFV